MGKKVMCFDPTFLPMFKSRGYYAIRRHSKVTIYFDVLLLMILIVLKGENIMQMDMLLFPIHKPRHWSLLVRKLKKCFFNDTIFSSNPQIVFPVSHSIHCVDSLHYSDEDAVNWIWWDIFVPLFHDMLLVICKKVVPLHGINVSSQDQLFIFRMELL